MSPTSNTAKSNGEAEIDARIARIRARNEILEKRHQEVEADKKVAEKSKASVTNFKLKALKDTDPPFKNPFQNQTSGYKNRNRQDSSPQYWRHTSAKKPVHERLGNRAVPPQDHPNRFLTDKSRNGDENASKNSRKNHTPSNRPSQRYSGNSNKTEKGSRALRERNPPSDGRTPSPLSPTAAPPSVLSGRLDRARRRTPKSSGWTCPDPSCNSSNVRNDKNCLQCGLEFSTPAKDRKVKYDTKGLKVEVKLTEAKKDIDTPALVESSSAGQTTWDQNWEISIGNVGYSNWADEVDNELPVPELTNAVTWNQPQAEVYPPFVPMQPMDPNMYIPSPHGYMIAGNMAHISHPTMSQYPHPDMTQYAGPDMSQYAHPAISRFPHPSNLPYDQASVDNGAYTQFDHQESYQQQHCSYGNKPKRNYRDVDCEKTKIPQKFQKQRPSAHRTSEDVFSLPHNLPRSTNESRPESCQRLIIFTEDDAIFKESDFLKDLKIPTKVMKTESIKSAYKDIGAIDPNLDAFVMFHVGSNDALEVSDRKKPEIEKGVDTDKFADALCDLVENVLDRIPYVNVFVSLLPPRFDHFERSGMGRPNSVRRVMNVQINLRMNQKGNVTVMNNRDDLEWGNDDAQRDRIMRKNGHSLTAFGMSQILSHWANTLKPVIDSVLSREAASGVTTIQRSDEEDKPVKDDVEVTKSTTSHEDTVIAKKLRNLEIVEKENEEKMEKELEN